MALLVPLTLNLGQIGLGMLLGRKLTHLSSTRSSKKKSIRSSMIQNKGRKETVQNSDMFVLTEVLK